jgi:ferrous iron transport protein B
MEEHRAMDPAVTASQPQVSNVQLLPMDQLAMGENATIHDLDGPDRVRRRLLEMGLVPGEQIQVVRKAPLGDPVVIQVLGYQLGLRKQQTACIQVSRQVTPREASAAAKPLIAGDTVSDVGRIALVGNPNCGKTTVFNALTGLHQKVGNYAGVTVERRIGRCQTDAGQLNVIDLPGTYSLTPSSPDERVVLEVLRGQQFGEPRPDAVVAVIDASNLARNLLLFTQLVDLGLPMVVALTMNDTAAARGRPVDAAALEAQLGVPVVPLIAHKKQGLDALRAALPQARIAQGKPWRLPAVLHQAVDQLHADLNGHLPESGARRCAERLLTGADSLIDYAKSGDEAVVVAVERIRKQLPPNAPDPLATDVSLRYGWIRALLPAVLGQTDGRSLGPSFTERLDHLLVHRVAGLGIFAFIMYSLFYLIYTVADPFMGVTEEVIGSFGNLLFGWMETGALRSLLLDGVVGGVGGVLVFVPQIAMLFLCIALLEESGYLARAAFLLDRLLAAVGLHGKSFIPLLSSHACAIPGIMAARNIDNHRDRLATMFVAPFMSCGARLPVYVLLIGVFLAPYGGLTQSLALFGCYTLGMVMAVLIAWSLKKTALPETPSAFLLELPNYQLPLAGQVARTVLLNSWLFVRKAGTVILGFSILLWAALYYPRLNEQAVHAVIQEQGLSVAAYQTASASEDPQQQAVAAQVDAALNGKQVASSIAGRAGHLIEPVIAPMGYDWKIGIGLVGAFAAREVFVSTMGVVYSVGDEANEESADLHQAMQSDRRDDGSVLWTLPTVISVLVFFVIAMQCISTIAVMRLETGGWRWPLTQLLVMNSIAYVLATLVYQIGSRL